MISAAGNSKSSGSDARASTGKSRARSTSVTKGGRTGGSRSGTSTLSTGLATAMPTTRRPTAAPIARTATQSVPPPSGATPSGLTAAQQQLARVRRRLDATTNRQQLRLTALRALQDSLRTATTPVRQAARGLPELPAPPALPRLPDLSAGTIRVSDTGAVLSYEQLLLRVFSEHMRLGEAASRPAVEDDVDTIADTVVELLAALPQFDEPWGPAIGPVYRTDQVRVLLGGVSRQALSDRVKRSTLLALKTRDGVWVYPVWQFSEGQVLPRLSEVLKLFTGDEHGEIVDAWTLASWLRIGLDALDGESVSDRLRAGAPEAAVAAARSAASRWSR